MRINKKPLPKVVLIAGGTAINKISQHLVFEKKFDVTILLNAYDDGKSTGVIRRDCGILGPSDIAKNLVSLIDPARKDYDELSAFLNSRLPQNFNLRDLQNMVSSLSKTSLENVEASTRNEILSFCHHYILHMEKYCQKKKLSEYSLGDFAIRNILFTGCFFKHNDYAITINSLRKILGVTAEIVLNSYDNLYLAGLTSSGKLLISEEQIVSSSLDERIVDIYCLDHYLTSKESKHISSLNLKKKRQYLDSLHIAPKISNETKVALQSADLICIGPSTLESSITPTLKTKSFTHELMNSSARKIVIANLTQERGNFPLSKSLIRLQEIFQQATHMDIPLGEFLDSVVVNTHGYQTGNQREVLIPIDKWEIQRLGLSLIEKKILISDTYKHDPSIITKVLLGELKRKKNKQSTRKMPVLRNYFIDPISTLKEKDKIEAFLKKKLLNKKPQHTIRVLIAAAGKQTRFESKIPKCLYPIKGKSTLIRLLEQTAKIDKEPILVINTQIENVIHSAVHPIFPKVKIVTTLPNGTGYAVHSTQSVLSKKVTHLLVMWGDSPNLTYKTMKTLINIAEVSPSIDILIASAWEKYPYAGIERDYFGNVSGLFQTKLQPNKKRPFGEHDASLFLIKISKVFPALSKEVADHPKDLDLNQFISKICKDKSFNVKAVAVCSPNEAASFNTIKEAEGIINIHD